MNRKLMIVIALLSILTVSQVSAQSKSRFGVKAGLNISMMTRTIYNNSVDLGAHVGFHAGFTSEIPLIANLYFNPGLFFSSKGYRTTIEVPGLTTKTTVNPYFVEIPLHIMFKLPISSSAIFAYTGPYFSYGIAGNRIVKTNSTILGDDRDKRKLNFGSDSGCDMKPFDMGLNVGAGFEVKHFQLSVQYGIGFLNLTPIYPENNSLRMNVLSVSAAYLF